ncbi:ETC complex I subunit conserved region-domain-containing protein [Pleurostoma richardsiae]|uniref:NADH dehydrogenase [ubiquinone] iron-sulfur protein 4, mitochondrial n=1 Tax=Pleurostoma richardsiae TaxID=41990 RepID=A0AA38S1T2_9PEZI|nr:ETC complex I subunit conserved region-domain-containing protein [Pleurostoma richardsiae]
MASLRTASAARMLRAASQRSMIVPAARRYENQLSAQRGRPPASTPAPPSTTHGPNQPDYEAHIDTATSTFTPVPKRVLDGSEEGEALPAAVLSGAPMELQARTVRIYKPAKPATQSGTWHGSRWRMDWDVLPKGHRWENPLIGWQSSGDFMQGTHINFKSKEDAIAFAEKQGYEYFVQEPNERKFAPKAYANNFLYSPKKLKHIRTK